MSWSRIFGLAALLVAVAAPLGAVAEREARAESVDPDGYVLPEHDTVIVSVGWRPDGRLLLTEDATHVRVWDISARKIARYWRRPDDERAPVWSPDGMRFATVDGSGRILIRDATTAEGSVRARFGTRFLSQVAWSPDGGKLAAVGTVGGVVVDAATGKRLARLESGDDYLGCVAWSPDGRRLATGGSKNILRVWSANTGKQLQKLVVEPHLQSHSIGLNEPTWSDCINAVAWSPDGRKVAAAYEEGTLRVWDPSEPQATEIDAHTLVKLPDRLFGSSYWGVLALAWSPDGQRLATAGGDGAVTVWNTGNWKPAWIYHPFSRMENKNDRYEGGARTVAWSPDGKWLAVGGWSAELHVRKTQPGPEAP